eukprot:gene23854-biopygen11866
MRAGASLHGPPPKCVQGHLHGSRQHLSMGRRQRACRCFLHGAPPTYVHLFMRRRQYACRGISPSAANMRAGASLHGPPPTCAQGHVSP